jgi:hypothetical protein
MGGPTQHHQERRLIVAGNRDRLIFRFFRLIEGEAEGRFAISALVFLLVAGLMISLALRVSLH